MTTFDATALSPALASLLTSDSTGDVPVTTETLRFESDGTAYEVFVARPDGASEHGRPGILIVSDWTGIGDYARVRAVMLARLGYIALAADIYGNGDSFGMPEASQQAGKYYGDPALFRSRLTANLEKLRAQPGVDLARIAAIGYCFGGSGALELARSGADLAAAVAFHGALRTASPAAAGAVKARVLVLTGTADPVVPDADVVGFFEEMRAAEVGDWQVQTYSGAMHAFTLPDAADPEHGAQYDARADARSWTAMKSFFSEIFAA